MCIYFYDFYILVRYKKAVAFHFNEFFFTYFLAKIPDCFSIDETVSLEHFSGSKYHSHMIIKSITEENIRKFFQKYLKEH